MLLGPLPPRVPGGGRCSTRSRFTLETSAEVVARVTASCAGCDWGRTRPRGRRARRAAARRTLRAAPRPDARATGRRRTASCSVAAGSGRASRGLRVDRSTAERSARAAALPRRRRDGRRPHLRPRRAGVRAPRARADPPGAVRQRRALQRPAARSPGTKRRRDGDGRRLRYSVVFSNEDGGTPPDRLMATWGRLTDLEYVYGVELDADGRIAAARSTRAATTRSSPSPARARAASRSCTW